MIMFTGKKCTGKKGTSTTKIFSVVLLCWRGLQQDSLVQVLGSLVEMGMIKPETVETHRIMEMINREESLGMKEMGG